MGRGQGLAEDQYLAAKSSSSRGSSRLGSEGRTKQKVRARTEQGPEVGIGARKTEMIREERKVK